ncbi:RNA polymerase sigma factor [Streptomyces sp. URMC 123]|uniref:RNA polymerase sigma factor n=1 Tax=Streptomyces sp. URMC 123 TaxID=3423403 RepID=UPI003F1B18CF
MVADEVSGEVSGDALLRLEGDVGQRLLAVYPDYMEQAARFLGRKFPGMPLAQREDVAQEAFLKAARKCLDTGIGPDRDLMGYLLVTAENLAVDGFRRNRLLAVADDDLDRLVQRSGPADERPWELQDVVLPAISAMNATQRRDVVELQSRGFSDEEIAAELRIPLGQVRVQRKRAIEELRRRLEGRIRRGQQQEQRRGEEDSGE